MASRYLMDQQVRATEIPAPRPPGPTPSGTAPPARLLVVEDDDVIREALRTMLIRCGYEVLTKGTGRDGLRSSCLQRADLVLLDVMLPDFDGMQLLRRLRTVSDVPVIFLTARSDPLDVVVGLESGPTTTSPSRATAGRSTPVSDASCPGTRRRKAGIAGCSTTGCCGWTPSSVGRGPRAPHCPFP
ncbi:response regulator [Streptomyces sp. NPDC059466]|uniref:response regulator n=1 Tax=unclassified Streptomyces TaxID=2593676 RepID=UPI0036C8D315